MAERVPQPLLIGIYGIEVTEEMVRTLRDTNAAGVYLQRRNIESTDQVRALIANLEQELGYRLLVAVDHEGGRVYRFTRGVTFFPGNLALGKTATPALAYEVGRAMGRELAGMGIDLNFAPVLDLESDDLRPELLLRSFGSDPALVGNMGAEMIRGFREAGVFATARTFPGKGDAVGKPNQSPVIATPRETILERDLAPFKVAIAGGLALVMTANAVYPALDPDQPAMFSSKVVTDLLRRDLGFNGVAVTEDLTSPSVLSTMSVEEAVVRALQAGNDLCVLAHDYESAKRAGRGLKVAVDGGRVPKSLFEKTQMRLQAQLGRKPARQSLSVDDPEEVEAAAGLAGIVAGGAVKIDRDPQKLLPIDYGRRVGMLVPRLWDVADRIVIDEELRGAASLIQGWIQSNSSTVEVLEIPIQPDGEMLGLTLDWAAGLEIVAFMCFDAHRFAGQRKLLEELQRRCPKVVAVLIANPWDRAFAKEQTAVVNTYGFRVCQLSAAISVLFKKA